MKLCIEEKIDGKKTGNLLFLDKIAPTRRELAQLLGSKEFFIDDQKYFVSQVYAKKNSDNTALGMVLGGILGLVGGAAGVAAGGAIGGVLGRDSDLKEQDKVDRFNRSKL